MGRGIINASAEEIYDLVRRPEMRHHYDSMLNEELTLENLQVNYSVPGPDAARVQAGLAARSSDTVGNLLVYYYCVETNRCFLRVLRDFCVLQVAKAVPMSRNRVKYVVAGASIEHPDCPRRDDVERAIVDAFGWVIEPIAPDRSKVSYMIHLDFGDSGVPTHLLNQVSFRQPLCIAYVSRFLEARRAAAAHSSAAAASSSASASTSGVGAAAVASSAPAASSSLGTAKA